MPCVMCHPLCQTAFFIRPTWMCPMASCTVVLYVVPCHSTLPSTLSIAIFHPPHYTPYTMASYVDMTLDISSRADEESGRRSGWQLTHDMGAAKKHHTPWHTMTWIRGDRAHHGMVRYIVWAVVHSIEQHSASAPARMCPMSCFVTMAWYVTVKSYVSFHPLCQPYSSFVPAWMCHMSFQNIISTYHAMVYYGMVLACSSMLLCGHSLYWGCVVAIVNGS